jgi:hypothetical protein
VRDCRELGSAHVNASRRLLCSAASLGVRDRHAHAMNEPSGSAPLGPTSVQLAATIALLADERVATVAAAREQLLRWGEHAVAALHDAAEADSLRVRVRCRSLLRAIEVRQCLRRFSTLRLGRTGRSAAPPLLEGAVLLSKMVRTFVPDAQELGAVLRREANELRAACGGRSLPTCARLLAERLHDKLGLRGRDALAPELDHVLIDRVLERRAGVPDHFLVRLHGVRPVLVDPYHAGRTITKVDCARYLRANGHDQVSEHLQDLTDREVLRQYLRCLRAAAAKRPVPETQQTLGKAMALLETS